MRVVILFVAIILCSTKSAYAEELFPVQTELSIVGPVCSKEEQEQDPDCNETKLAIERLFSYAWDAHWKKRGPEYCGQFRRTYNRSLMLESLAIMAGDDVPPTKKHKKVRRHYTGIFRGDVYCSSNEKQWSID